MLIQHKEKYATVPIKHLLDVLNYKEIGFLSQGRPFVIMSVQRGCNFARVFNLETQETATMDLDKEVQLVQFVVRVKRIQCGERNDE